MTIPFSVLKQPQLSKWWLIAEVKDWRVRLEKRVSVYMQWYESLFVVYTFLTARSLGQSTFKQVQRVNFVQTIVQHALDSGFVWFMYSVFYFFFTEQASKKDYLSEWRRTCWFVIVSRTMQFFWVRIYGKSLHFSLTCTVSKKNFVHK